MITSSQLRQIATSLTPQRAVILANAINKACADYEVTSYDVLHELLANILHESGEFSILAERMNYTTPSVLANTWPTRFSLTPTPGKKLVTPFLRNPRVLANEVYNGRMGNRPNSNDGFEFRGGGFAQITGRDAYTLYTAFLNRKGNKYTIQQVAALVMTDDNFAMDSAFWFACEWKNLEQLALQDNFRELVRRWNGGYIGMPERQKYLTRCVEVLK